MGVVEGRTWLEVLSPGECRTLLASRSVGRLAYMVQDHPEVLPVNYALDGHAIVFRTDSGTKLRAALTQPKVAFEVDDADGEKGVGWSVLVVGHAERVSDAEELRRLTTIGVRPMAYGEKGQWVRIQPGAVTGRRIVLGAGD